MNSLALVRACDLIQVALCLMGCLFLAPQAALAQGSVDDAEIRLMRNENPRGVPPSVQVQVVKDIGLASSRYADYRQKSARTALAAKLGVPYEAVAFGNGSDEIIRILPKILLGRGQNMVAPRYSYIGHRESANFNGVPYLEADVGPRFEVQVESILKKVNRRTGFVILANPSNPTGATINQEQMDRLASALEAKGVTLVIDMAYREYVTDTKAVADPFQTMRAHSNVILTGTFSKIYGMAGLRAGYLIASPEVISRFDSLRESSNASNLALRAAEVALADDEWVRTSREANHTERERLSKALTEIGLDVYPSQGNFLLVRVGPGAQALVENILKTESIGLLRLAHYELPEFVRISIGLPDTNKKLIDHFKSQQTLIRLSICESSFVRVN